MHEQGVRFMSYCFMLQVTSANQFCWSSLLSGTIISPFCLGTDIGKLCSFYPFFFQVAIVVLGNKIDLSEQRQVDAEVAQQWAKSEKVRLWEVTVTDRKTLIEPFTLLASKLSQPQSKSSFPLPGRKNKGNSSSENWKSLPQLFGE